jgi:haloalkane dehalogenase
VVLLHGIPVHSYLWRNVIPHISPFARTIAIDLIGCGKSDKPVNIDYNVQTYSRYIEKALESLKLKNILLVGMDLGLIAGLHYAMQHETNIRGIVMFEGFFQPMSIAYKNLPLMNQITLRILKNRQIAERMMIRDGIANVKKMIAMTTIRKLSTEEMNAYQTPFFDETVRRKVWLEGVGPTVIKAESDQPGDTVDLINKYAAKLSTSPVPKLLLYAKPGAVITNKAIKNARKNVSNLELQYIGKGKHFLPEDQPENIGKAIAEFYQKIG